MSSAGVSVRSERSVATCLLQGTKKAGTFFFLALQSHPHFHASVTQCTNRGIHTGLCELSRDVQLRDREPMHKT